MRTLFMSLVAVSVLVAHGKTEPTCAASTDLESLVTCIRGHMPRSGSNGYVPPASRQRADWRRIVKRMLEGSCDFAVPASLDGIVQVRTFTEAGSARRYCLLMEVGDRNRDGVVDHGFGTFIVDNRATRQLSHQAVHPIADSATDSQAVTVFKRTDSRSYVMAGAHRGANSAPSSCRRSFPVSDASHNRNTMVQATNEALLAYYGAAPWFAIQWHGMAASTCPTTDVYPTHGRGVTPAATDRIAALRYNLLALHPTWRVDLPGSGSCDLDATENVQGRLLNGIAAASVCTTAASDHTQRFLHIEQDPGFRNPDDWIAPIIKTFP